MRLKKFRIQVALDGFTFYVLRLHAYTDCVNMISMTT